MASRGLGVTQPSQIEGRHSLEGGKHGQVIGLLTAKTIIKIIIIIKFIKMPPTKQTCVNNGNTNKARALGLTHKKSRVFSLVAVVPGPDNHLLQDKCAKICIIEKIVRESQRVSHGCC